MAITYSETLKKALKKAILEYDPDKVDRVATYATVDVMGKVIERGTCVRQADGKYQAVTLSPEDGKYQTVQEEQNDYAWKSIFNSPDFQAAQERMEKAALSQRAIEHVMNHNAFMQKVMQSQLQQSLYGEDAFGAGQTVLGQQKAMPVPSAPAVEEPTCFKSIPEGKAMSYLNRIQSWADKRGYIVREMPMVDCIMIDTPRSTIQLKFLVFLKGLIDDDVEGYLARAEDDARAKEVGE